MDRPELFCVRQALCIANSCQTALDGLEDDGFKPDSPGEQVLEAESRLYRRTLSRLKQWLRNGSRILSSAGFPMVPNEKFVSLIEETIRLIEQELAATKWPSPTFQQIKDVINLLSKTAHDAEAAFEGRVVTSSNNSVRCILFSDLHLGMEDQVWQNVRNAILKAVASIHKAFPIDLILFPGDLVNSGLPSQFDELDKLFEDIWKIFKPSGYNPILLTVPGNHDLVRDKSANAKHLLTFPEEFRPIFWSDPHSRKPVFDSFKNYENWLKKNIQVQDSEGKGIIQFRFGNFIPGDFSCTLKKPGKEVSIGVLGLNSAFLGIGDTPCEGKLVVDVSQANDACGGSCAKWIDEHDFTVVMTHHPLEWLTPKAKKHFETEINSNNRFGLHIYGHMHESAAGNNYSQIASLYGREKFRNRQGEWDMRIHGFSLLEISKTSTGVVWRIKPVRLSKNYEWNDDHDVPRLTDTVGWTPKMEYKKTPQGVRV